MKIVGVTSFGGFVGVKVGVANFFWVKVFAVCGRLSGRGNFFFRSIDRY